MIESACPWLIEKQTCLLNSSGSSRLCGVPVPVKGLRVFFMKLLSYFRIVQIAEVKGMTENNYFWLFAGYRWAHLLVLGEQRLNLKQF